MPRDLSGATRPTITARMGTAFHESGHAVLSTAINDGPTQMSVRPRGHSLGRSSQKMLGRPELLAQVHVPGFCR